MLKSGFDEEDAEDLHFKEWISDKLNLATGYDDRRCMGGKTRRSINT